MVPSVGQQRFVGLVRVFLRAPRGTGNGSHRDNFAFRSGERGDGLSDGLRRPWGLNTPSALCACLHSLGCATPWGIITLGVRGSA